MKSESVATKTARLTKASRTKECARELASSLVAFRDKLGLAIEPAKPHLVALTTEGVVGIPYARDGVQHTPWFRLEATAGGCTISFFKRGYSSPGETKLTLADYGTIKLTECACE